MTSRERVVAVVKGERLDRIPTFENLRHKKIIEYLAGCKLTVENAKEVIPKALGNGFDACWLIRYPHKPCIERKGGFIYEVQEWTEWMKKRPFSTVEECKKFMEASIEKGVEKVNFEERRKFRNDYLVLQRKLGDCVCFMGAGGVNFPDSIYGIELFTYTCFDYPDVFSKYLEVKNEIEVNRIKALTDSTFSPLAGIAKDIAYNDGLLFSSEFLRKNFIPYLERAVEAYHDQGVKVIFHSDGYLMQILPDLVAAGIDGLNPVDYEAGMRLSEIRKRYKNLLLVGGIDAKRLLMFGTPEEVRKATRKAIRDASPGYFVGSSGAIYDPVPVDNLKAMLEVAHTYRC